MERPSPPASRRIPLGLRKEYAAAQTAENNRGLRIVAIAATAISAIYVLQNILAPGFDPGANRLLFDSYLWGFGDLALISLAYLAWTLLFGKDTVDGVRSAIHTVYVSGILLGAAFITAVDLSHERDYSAIGFASTAIALAWRTRHAKAVPVFTGTALACIAFLAMGRARLELSDILPVFVACAIAIIASFILESSSSRSFLLQAELKEQSSKDALTGLRNRRFLNESAGLLIAGAHRNQMPICVLVFDLDNFKLVNDEKGHLVGDEVLRGVGRLIGSSLRSSDLVVRYGGEEFLAILVDTPLDGGILTAERLRRLVSALEVPQLGRHVTISCGVAALAEGEGFEDCVARADARLYEAKAKGRDRTEY